ncbi:MAG: alpha-glucoside ABC transporter permease [Marinomonas sp.]|jgi:alpha-glucoside transport system permease protein|uniref:Maltose ABC transporter membrane protein /trehalose ABC transporter membrane protein /sucrose ABC transporter membrane protein n=1 Tax=Marinomonas communis TaxID=28254 RepID=A0A4R6X5L8_9GAMM|nr:sugar ABC transporter permease [Marinomonas communis]MEC8080341.1 sugar ABC transporter permease [Pseudomonadota bacterium]RUM51455.1 MAG: alpha-glucoside ABC transporter permease [Marinomonas sp.]MCC4274394.1 sugar ABC transporter permease [Marinomonas communis]RUM54185.1 MAG: alpha-glucoside ABC transporter permease [Marinomonas sp.]TDR14256.1 maltose ABC transporter membrane protein /trehalose ABC transporter membrane protein /sucrose ABC transporter membrane protein [Marinomonas communi
MGQLAVAFVTMTLGVLACAGYFYGSNALLDVIFPSKNRPPEVVARNLRIVNQVRPWLFLGPALLLLFFYLFYPVVQSVILSFYGRTGEEFVGLDNYLWLFQSGEFLESFRNNMLWLIVVPTLSTFFGLIIATMTDRIWWGNIAKTLIFMPMAISFIGASIIWKFIYEYRSGGDEQIGLLNALVVFFGGEPQTWIQIPFWNNFFLMVILVWIQTGFAMVILSAALRGIPDETIEAAVLDGASGLQIFFRIMVPQIWGTIAVVWTTITILVLKVFDIVLAMTNGQWGTQVLANQMFSWLFQGGGDYGRSAVIALVIMILVVPIMVWNIKNANAEMEGR